jgi:hypothetical protein
VLPRQAAVGEAGPRRADRLADRQVEIVRWDLELALADPVLEQAGVDVDEGGAPEAGEQGWVDRVMEIEQQVGAAEERLRLGPAGADKARALLTV